MARATAGEQRQQLSAQRRKVDFDTYDVTVDELLRRVGKKRIEIAPIYQRQFRWDTARQSALVESILLGIPVPPLFMATNRVADQRDRWEVVDGLQRLLTLVNFAGDTQARVVAKLSEESSLRISDLEKLENFNGFHFSELPEDIQAAFEDRPLRVVVLNDKSDLQVRYDLFERLNTGGIELTPQEIRECVWRGEFIDLLGDLAQRPYFRKVVVLAQNRWKDGTPEEFVLRFFAYTERYMKFDHLVGEFLNEFVQDAFNHPRSAQRDATFTRTFTVLAEVFLRDSRPEGDKLLSSFLKHSPRVRL